MALAAPSPLPTPKSLFLDPLCAGRTPHGQSANDETLGPCV